MIVLSPTSNPKYIKFHFAEEAVIAGMIITTKLEKVLKSFRVYANTRVSDPYDFTTEPQLLKKEFNVMYQLL